MSAWWSLPHAIPILIRHVLGYAELAEEDLARFSNRAAGRLVAIALAAFGAFFSVLLICVAVIAWYWDTHSRMAAIFCMLGVFLILTALALVSLFGGPARVSMFASVKHEWRQDRVILDRWLSGNIPQAADSSSPVGSDDHV